MHRWAWFMVGLVLGMSLAVAQPQEARPTPVDPLEEAWLQPLPEHPRLWLGRDGWGGLRGQLAQDPLAQDLIAELERHAALLLEVPPVERKLRGRRLLHVSREVLARVLTLAVAYHTSGDARFVRRAEVEMLAVSAFEDWNPGHFLDVGEMAMALAIGYDWLYDELDPPARQRVRQALLEKALATSWKDPDASWIGRTNNWNAVCHGGLSLAAIACLEDSPELARRTLRRAIAHIPRGLHVYAPNGAYPEGPAYWEYGTSYAVWMLSACEGVWGTDFGIRETPGFHRTGQYPALVTGPSGLFFNYADGGPYRHASPALLWLAQRYARPDWLWGERERIARAVRRMQRSASWYGRDRFLPLALLWWPSAQALSEPQLPLHWSSGGPVPISVHRSSWNDDQATFVGLKAGSPSAAHGQMDIGSFVLESDRVRWAVDLGSQSYHSIESLGMNLWGRGQASDRWKVFRLQNLSHNTLVIDGQGQQVAGTGRFVGFSEDPEHPSSRLDLSEVYAGQARSVKRGVALTSSGQVLLQDEMEGVPEGHTVQWNWFTEATVEAHEKGQLKLRHGEASLWLLALDDSAMQWTVTDASQPVNPWDASNPGLTRLSWEAVAPASGQVRFRVWVTPGRLEAPAEAPPFLPLKDWP